MMHSMMNFSFSSIFSECNSLNIFSISNSQFYTILFFVKLSFLIFRKLLIIKNTLFLRINLSFSLSLTIIDIKFISLYKLYPVLIDGINPSLPKDSFSFSYRINLESSLSIFENKILNDSKYAALSYTPVYIYISSSVLSFLDYSLLERRVVSVSKY
jgi:hypothetical protein